MGFLRRIRKNGGYVIKSSTPPADTSSQWVDTSTEDYVTKMYDESTSSWKTISGSVSKIRSFSFYINGDMSVEASIVGSIVPMDLTIKEVRLSIDTAPAGADLIIDVNKNGTTIFSTQANRPTITATTNSVTSVAPDATSILLGDKISIDIDQVGSTTVGSNLAITVICEEV